MEQTLFVFSVLRYVKARYVLRDDWVKIDSLFANFISSISGKKALQIGARGSRYSKDFVSVDLYDHSSLIDYHYDIHDLKFCDCEFDVVVCNAVLEHVENPHKAISELFRVLKSGGQIWVEVPMNQPYHPAPADYWRVTLPGLELWLRNFKKISSGCFGNFLYNGIYFHGEKP